MVNLPIHFDWSHLEIKKKTKKNKGRDCFCLLGRYVSEAIGTISMAIVLVQVL